MEYIIKVKVRSDLPLTEDHIEESVEERVVRLVAGDHAYSDPDPTVKEIRRSLLSRVLDRNLR